MHKLPLIVGYSYKEGWLACMHSFYLMDKLYTAEWYLLFKCLDTLLYAKQKCLGILNPFTAEFVPQTEKENAFENFKL